MFIPIEQLDESAKRYKESAPNLSRGTLPSSTSSSITRGNVLGNDESFAKRREMLEHVNQEPVEFALERAIGKNDSVYSNFVELIHNAKQKVGRIFIKRGNKKLGFATGFMISEQLMLTNWHVFKNIEEVADSEIQFFYEYDVYGNQGIPVSFKLQSESFYHSNKELDYCIVAVHPTDITGNKNLSDIGYIFLDPTLGKLGNEQKEALNIIHHPEGDFKQLSIRENLFIKITPTSVWYQTDTAPGSSGSPVFNDQWQVVALHHMGIGKKNTSGDYIDKNGDPIPRVGNTMDTSKIVWEANEGIRISVILHDLFSNSPNKQIIKSIQVKPKALTTTERINTKQETNINIESNHPSNNINISIPSSLLDKNGSINVSISQGNDISEPKETQINITDVEELAFAETKKLEEAIDFSACKGYQPKFLGSKFNIELPKPMPSIKKLIAQMEGTANKIELKYHHYSCILHTTRKMPIISAINVDGDPKKRLDSSKRNDIWLRDTRLSFDHQLDDSFYKRSGFDRGHMSRREDANWGATPDEAKRNADLTCMHTNACPQVALLNQSSRKGLWGILEKIVLESGAEIEKKKTAKISVLNGPIFKDSDPVFRGIQIPMNFYKIVLWLTDKGTLKATAFKLSQENLVSDIDFEELNLDQNVAFKEYQCSIKSLQEETQINFAQIIPFDTFRSNKQKTIVINSEQEVMALIGKHQEG